MIKGIKMNKRPLVDTALRRCVCNCWSYNIRLQRFLISVLKLALLTSYWPLFNSVSQFLGKLPLSGGSSYSPFKIVWIAVCHAVPIASLLAQQTSNNRADQLRLRNLVFVIWAEQEQFLQNSFDELSTQSGQRKPSWFTNLVQHNRPRCQTRRS